MNMWNVAVAVIALALLLPAVNVALSDEAEDFDASETATVDYTDPYELDNQSVYSYGDLEVEVGGSELTEGADYEFVVSDGRFGEDGAIEWNDTLATNDGDTATVDYTFQNHSQQTKDQVGVLSTAAAWAPYVLLIVAVLATVRYSGGGGF